MRSAAQVDLLPSGWHVAVKWGTHTEVYGPYRWLWVARIVAWLNDGLH